MKQNKQIKNYKIKWKINKKIKYIKYQFFSGIFQAPDQ